ncbi:hypothetical protein PROFUN_02541 [Planoprotostelium fungivorum]|uniref:Uncharacterized protein n=1 Tax=Planoprotostelium fungivorum TaxID=1890364 RepID=A0A2P6MPC2_9EUKA|nr:hypothetical protein PROFUN_02541 [Planoprotostelium fungivorum]
MPRGETGSSLLDEDRDDVSLGYGGAPKRRATENVSQLQAAYVLISHCIVPGIINFVINGLIAWIRWKEQTEVYVWSGPGHLAVGLIPGIFIQSTITWIMNGALCSNDIRKGMFGLSPLATPSFYEGFGPKIRWFITPCMDLFQPGIVNRTRLLRLRNLAMRGFLLGCVSFFIMWPSTALLLSKGYEETLEPSHAAVFFGVFYALLALWQTPLIAFIAMIRIGQTEEEETLMSPIPYGVAVTSKTLTLEPRVRLPVREHLFSRQKARVRASRWNRDCVV